jgi:hypothetical protein
MSRLEAKGKGILLLHDIQARTVAALPRILHELKVRGFRIVHVVPATPERLATPTEPEQWRMRPSSENVAIAHWPKIPNFVFADAGTIPAAALSDFDWLDAQALAEPFDRPRRPAYGVPLPREAPWPRLPELPSENAAITLPAPAQNLFEMPDGLRVALRSASSSHHAEQAGSSEHDAQTKLASANTGDSRRPARGKFRLGHGPGHNRQHRASRVAGHASPPAAAAHRGPLKHLVQVKKRNA